MNANGVMTTENELLEFEIDLYETMQKTGTFRMRLEGRSWTNTRYGGGIVCYFTELKEDIGYKLFAWRSMVDGKEIYHPRKCGIDFATVLNGTVWDCTTGKNRKGKTEWVDAVPVIGEER